MSDRMEGRCSMIDILWSIVATLSIFFFSIARTMEPTLPQTPSLSPLLACRLVGGLARSQKNACADAPDAAALAFEGLQMAVKECQHQFRWHRWNCTSLASRANNPHSSAIMKRGYRESAYMYALAAAGVAHAVARGCAEGRLLSCGCDPLGYRASRAKGAHRSAQRWKWAGCSHNLEYGLQFSRRFLDGREHADDLQSRINLHNNNAGRLALAANMEVRCKCHGTSGSCQLKTCWRAAPDFRVVASALKRRYRSAVLVDTEGLNSGTPVLMGKTKGKQRGKARAKRAPTSSLLYFERSPSFCEVDLRSESYGTSGRVCRAGVNTGRGRGGCGVMCCGRGYALVRRSRLKPCHCKFHWCCTVNCQQCHDDKWVAVCK